MMEFKVKTVKKLLKFFNVPYAKIDSTTTTLNRGNAILNKEVVLFSDTRDSLRGLAYPALSYSCMHEEKLYTAVEEIFYCSQEVALAPNRHSG
jgi:hypothetical protein